MSAQEYGTAPNLHEIRRTKIEYHMPWGDGKQLQLSSTNHLSMSRCPHCSTANPTLAKMHQLSVQPMKHNFIAQVGGLPITWHIYICASCAGLVAGATMDNPQLVSTGPEQIYWIVPNP